MKIRWQIIALMGLLACQNTKENPEQITKLRALGVKINPYLITNATDQLTVSLEFYFARPSTGQQSSEVFVSNYAEKSVIPYAPLEINTSQITFTGYPNLEVLKVPAVANLERLKAIPIRPEIGFQVIPFGAQFASGGEEQTVVGRMALYNTEASLAFNEPTFEVLSPKDGENTQSPAIELNAQINSNGGEDYRISWFVSAGELANRTAKMTAWESIPIGSHTLIFTARGRKTNAFFLKVLTITRS